jgi:hypothetical protein
MDDTILALEAALSDGLPPIRAGISKTGKSVERLEFEIDGPAGERIISVESFWIRANTFLGFKVSYPQLGYILSGQWTWESIARVRLMVKSHRSPLIGVERSNSRLSNPTSTLSLTGGRNSRKLTATFLWVFGS